MARPAYPGRFSAVQASIVIIIKQQENRTNDYFLARRRLSRPQQKKKRALWNYGEKQQNNSVSTPNIPTVMPWTLRRQPSPLAQPYLTIVPQSPGKRGTSDYRSQTRAVSFTLLI